MTPSSERARSKTQADPERHTARGHTWLTLGITCSRWFCHVDDDNYLNADALLRLLSQYSHAQDVYIGRPSLERPIEATEMLGSAQTVTPRRQVHSARGSGSRLTRARLQKRVRFWFATGGAGFCLSRGLALKMRPWAR